MMMPPPPPPPQLPPSSQNLPSSLTPVSQPPQYSDNNNNNINNNNNNLNLNNINNSLTKNNGTSEENNKHTPEQKPLLSDLAVSKEPDTTPSDQMMQNSDQVMSGSEFLAKPEPQNATIGGGGGEFTKMEQGVNVVVKEEVLDSNIIPTS